MFRVFWAIYMSEFEKSEWAEKNHAQEFMENADIYIVERNRLFEILKSFYRYFLGNEITDRTIRILDLGCGNGALTMELLKVDKGMQATLVDGSSEMLNNARGRLKSYDDLTYMHETFQELLKKESEGFDPLSSDFDFIISSLAIHHLYTEEKKSLFKYILQHLNKGGYFLNIEVVKAPAEELENWYRVLWREWIEENETKINPKESFGYLPEQYKNNPDNHPDSLESQLNALKSIGFKKVDCYYKYGIFSIYGGRK
jgi:tRNA (cmo5U34)-methyltransferase